MRQLSTADLEQVLIGMVNGHPSSTLLEVLCSASRVNKKLWIPRDVTAMRATVQHYYRLHKPAEMAAEAGGHALRAGCGLHQGISI